nr:anthranilate phosphoribosyltransferase [Blastocatellia bacterium]
RLGRNAAPAGAETLLDALISETDEALLASLFAAWNEKGIAEDEIVVIASVLRHRCLRVTSRHDVFADIVGTGGSLAKTFNVSTAAAFVAAGGGLAIAKHGNRAATSASGSADVLEQLGVRPGNGSAERCLNDIGICFMFAPEHHRLSPTLAKVRRGLGFPTIFNCVGPLCNPAGAPHQLIGVWNAELVPIMANALSRLGTKRSWIVHGKSGLDEIAISGTTAVAEVNGNSVTQFEIEPEAMSPVRKESENIRTSSPAESAALIRTVLNGHAAGSAAESIVLMNAAAAFYIAGAAPTFSDGVEMATVSIRSGAASKKLTELAEATQI